MSSDSSTQLGSHIRARRRQLRLTQSALARRAGISRQALLAIEHGHVPRADTALRLAQALDTSVEQLFAPTPTPAWVWAGPAAPRATWSLIRGRLVLFAATSVVADVQVTPAGPTPLPEARPPERVLVVAGCDPALPVTARWFERLHPGFWCDPLSASSQDALAMLTAGTVHVAGLHLYHADGYNRPWAAATRLALRGVRAALFEVGWAARSDAQLEHWQQLWQTAVVAMGPSGSETRSLAERTAQASGLDPQAAHAVDAKTHDHAALHVTAGLADLTVIPRVVAQLHGLAFRPLALQPFDWVARTPLDDGVEQLLAVLSHQPAQRSLAHLPGYSLEHAGDTVWDVLAKAPE